MTNDEDNRYFVYGIFSVELMQQFLAFPNYGQQYIHAYGWSFH